MVQVIDPPVTIPQIPQTRLLPRDNDYSEIGGATTGSAKILTKHLTYQVQAEWYGAVADGTTDNTAAFLAAATAVDAAGGGVILLRAGIYKVSTVVTFTSLDKVSWLGSGSGQTVVKSAVAVGTPGAGDPYIFFFNACTDFSVRDITFNGDNIVTTAANTMLVGALSCTNLRFENIQCINFKRFGLGINSCVRFWVNKSYYLRTTTENSYQNGSIRLFATAGTCGPGWIEDNEIDGAGIGYEGTDITYAFNRITNFGYGAGIVTNASATSLRAHIIGNIISGGTGQDVDGTYPSGIESYGAYSRIIGNHCRNNSGNGITFGGQQNIVADNICIDNGSVANVGVGIANNYQDATYNGSYSLVSNNICRQVGGIYQGYGYADIGVGNASTSLSFTNNDFSANGTADFLKSATSTLYSWVGKVYQFSDSWNPGLIAAGASATKAVTAAGATQGDFVQVSFVTQANDGLMPSGYVYGTNTALAILFNPTGAGVTPASGTVYVSVTKKAPF